MRARLSRITQGNISDAAWSRAGLPLAMGGLGLTQNARICSAAFISSSNMTAELVEKLVIQDAHTIIPDPALSQAIEHYESLITSEVGDSTTQNRSTLTLALHSRARAMLLAGADLRNNARLLSLTLPQAHSWLLISTLRTYLAAVPNEFRQAARYRLGVSEHNLRCRQCDKVQNPRDQGLSGDHSTQCHCGGSIHRRHNRLQDILYRTLKGGRLHYPDGNCSSHTRQPHPSWRRLRAGLVMTAWQLHMTSLWSRLLWNLPYLRPRVLSALRRIRKNAGNPSTTRSTALVRGYILFRWRRRR
jgi:hypothetical protein